MDEEQNASDFVDQRIDLKLAQERELEMGYPIQEKKDTPLQFLRDIWKSEDPKELVKVSNLKDEEAGHTKTPVLTYLNVGAYAQTEGYGMVREFLEEKAGNVAISTMGRKSKFLDASFTMRRESRLITPTKETRKKGFFGGETVTKEGGEE